ncbi:MAG TPA: tetratricopeptide repeat protein [Candidatus Dormibacteraeota bacterium]|nr:tetratricopeptide repeat protein [Candidatus Dormibacteraeota bacterium]
MTVGRETAGGSGEPGKAAPSRRRGRRLGVDIRPGSVKQARLQAGLSLGKVARDDISRTAIYFVETGKAKPSLETLRLIAERTGQPMEFFLAVGGAELIAPALVVAELERLLSTGDNRAVVTAADGALARRPDPDTAARINLLASMAHLRLAEAVVGRRLAATARSHFEQTGNLEMVAECLGNEAQAASLMHDPAAVSIAEGALATCRSLRPVPRAVEARLLRVLGHSLVHANRWDEAIASYEEAIAATEIVHDLQQLSLVYSGLSLAYQETGQINEAVRYAQKALTMHETLRDRLSQARSLNNIGWMLVRLGQLEGARAHLVQARAIFDELGVETRKADILHSLAELELADGNVAEAVRVAGEGLELATRLDEGPALASLRTLLGRIAAREGRDGDADREFAAALTAAEASGGSRLMNVHEAYAEILEARGDLAAANRQLRQAIAAYRPAASEALESRIAIA